MVGEEGPGWGGREGGRREGGGGRWAPNLPAQPSPTLCSGGGLLGLPSV